MPIALTARAFRHAAPILIRSHRGETLGTKTRFLRAIRGPASSVEENRPDPKCFRGLAQVLGETRGEKSVTQSPPFAAQGLQGSVGEGHRTPLRTAGTYPLPATAGPDQLRWTQSDPWRLAVGECGGWLGWC